MSDRRCACIRVEYIVNDVCSVVLLRRNLAVMVVSINTANNGDIGLVVKPNNILKDVVGFDIDIIYSCSNIALEQVSAVCLCW